MAVGNGSLSIPPLFLLLNLHFFHITVKVFLLYMVTPASHHLFIKSFLSFFLSLSVSLSTCSK